MKALVVGGVSVALVLTGCTGGGATPESSTMTIARPQDVITLDPSTASENASIWTDQLLYSTLVESSEDGLSTVPALAESYETSDDGLTWTFHLRTDVAFSDGSDLDADDVVFSIERNLAPEAPWSFMLATVAEVSAVDADTVQIVTTSPAPTLLPALSLFANAIVPDDFGGASAEEFFEAPVGTGPFVLDSWERGSKMTLTANPEWWGEPLRVETLEFTVVPNDNTRVLQLQGGQVDVIESPPLAQLESLNSGEITAEAFPSTFTRLLALNHARAPFDDPHVRAAIASAVDREALIDAALFGYATPATSWISENMPYHVEVPETPSFDLDAAKAEMALSSVPDGFTTSLVVAAGDTVQSALAQAVQAQLEPLGIQVELQSVESTAFAPDYLLTGNFDMILSYYTSDVPDPDEIASFYAGSGFLVGYDDPTAAEITAAAATEPDEAARAELYAQLQTLFATETVSIPLYYAPAAYAYGPGAPDFGVTALGAYTLASFQ